MMVFTVTDMLTGKLNSIWEAAEDALARAGQMSSAGGCGFAQGFEVAPSSKQPEVKAEEAVSAEVSEV